MKAPELRFRIGADTYEVRIGEFTPRDAADYRRAVGVPLMQAFGQMDLDTIAGFVWLVRRRLQPSLTYDEVADSFTYDDYLGLDDAPDGEPDADPADPSR